MPGDIEKALKRCFYPREGKPNLRKVPEDLERARQHIEKARSNLRAMKIMFDNGLYDWTIICGYYAMYHAVLASLFRIGIRAATHFCTIAAFKKFYIERGKAKTEFLDYIKRAEQLEKKYAVNLEKAHENRVIEQYGAEIVSREDAVWIIGDAEDFVLKIEEVLAG